MACYRRQPYVASVAIMCNVDGTFEVTVNGRAAYVGRSERRAALTLGRWYARIGQLLSARWRAELT